MAKNFVPQHKTAIKAIIDTIEWDSQTFGQRELAGNIHVFKNERSEYLNYPSLAMKKVSDSSTVIDTQYNRVEINYRIRVYYTYQEKSDEAIDVIDEIINLIHSTFKDYFYGGNNQNSWEQMRFGSIGEATEIVQGLVYQDIILITSNTELRVTKAIPI